VRAMALVTPCGKDLATLCGNEDQATLCGNGDQATLCRLRVLEDP